MSAEKVKFAARAPDGRLIYLGRLDAQINLRGFRVELGEIESVLRTDAEVADAAAAVATLHGDEHSLVAIVVPAPGAEPSARGLRELCRRRLPAYMVPDRIEAVEAVPTAPGGGKVDRSAVAALAVRSARSVRTR